MLQTAQADVAIFGGGIAGLWLLNQLHKQGYTAILLECNSLGGGQTHMSQGILHGGMKYALQGELTSASNSISSAPEIWRKCLAGSGSIDLSSVPILSPVQNLWTTESLISRISGFVAKKTLNAAIKSLTKNEYPEIFKQDQFKGKVFSFNEQVIDVNALIQILAAKYKDYIFKIKQTVTNDLHCSDSGLIKNIIIQGNNNQRIKLISKNYIFTAGAGNIVFKEKSDVANCSMQLRPLHMIMVKHDLPFNLYAHCLGMGATPRVTITTHNSADGKKVWYLGGQIAEQGVKLTADDQIQAARSELAILFPWLDFSKAEFISFRVDRAEAQQQKFIKPNSFTINKIYQNASIAWPTKLVLTPLLVNELLKFIEDSPNQKNNLQALNTFARPRIAKPIWETMF